MIFNKNVKITALLLLFVTLFVSIPVPVLALPLDIIDSIGDVNDDMEKVIILHNGAEKSSVPIPKGFKISLENSIFSMSNAPVLEASA